MTEILALLLLLFGLEIVLNVDNILVISIFVENLPENQRGKARFIGLFCALMARVFFIGIVVSLANLRAPIIYQFSIRDIILVLGALFLLWKAIGELYNTIELKRDVIPEAKSNISSRFISVVSQIVLLDIVFSIDSVITAVGLTNQLWIIILAVVFSFIVMLWFSSAIGAFILSHPSIKIIALVFLVTVGINIFMEGVHKYVPKQYLYLPMGFALLIELLQLRRNYNKKENDRPANRQ